MPSLVTQEQIAENVRVLLARRQIVQADLARAMGMSNTRLSRRIRGVAPFKAEELAAVADFLDIPISDLLAAA